MANSKTGGNGEKTTDIEDILIERHRLEQVLKNDYSKEVTILFSDICGYTRYVDDRGDISGRTMLIQHNQIVLPIIDAHNGKVVEIIGDAVMSCFDDPLDAVMAAADIQQRLAAYNLKAADDHGIHVRIGIHLGETLIDENAKFQSITGDVAIVASRIQGKAEKDQVMISKAVYKRVCGSEDILCRYHGLVELKGKAEPQAIYRLMWHDEEIILEEPTTVRGYHAPEPGAARKVPRVLHVEVAQERDVLRISVHEGARGEAITIRNYEDIDLSMDFIDARCQELVDSLNRFNQKGHITRDAVLKLREIGQILYDRLFSPAIKEKFESTEAEFLCLNLDESLVHIPWELLNDGRNFLCRRFAMGRMLKTRQSLIGNRTRDLARPLKMLVVADPTGDLNGAYTEGIRIRDFLEPYVDDISVALRSDNIYAGSIRGKMRNFDIVHFAGHADYQPENAEESGWRLSDGILKAKDILNIAGTSAMPALIFSNSCQSARGEEWTLAKSFEDEIFGMANAFLLAGVKHYVGTFWEIMDGPSSHFALEFYRHVASGATVGEAFCQARKALIRQYAEETIVWASYVLYGAPTFSYMDQIHPQDRVDHAETSRAREPVHPHQEAGQRAVKAIKTKSPARWIVAAVSVFIVVALLWGYPGLMRTGPDEKESQALARFYAGNYSEAREMCLALVDQYPSRALSHVILGNIYFSEGEKTKAHQHYQLALATEAASPSQKANAMLGLGRIASAGDHPDEALDNYRRAAELDPQNARAYLSQAVILATGNNYDDALQVLSRAKTLAPDEPGIDVLMADIRRQTELLTNREKQARIDRLVGELLSNMDAAAETVISDGWTSAPLTVWLMDLETSGYGLDEGENRIVHSGIVDAFIESSRVHVVERAFLDKLMQELKLGTTRLADRQTALSLGKLVAARAIIPGRIIHQGPQTQASFRIIDTETGEILAAINHHVAKPVPSVQLAESLSAELLAKFDDLYPLRGKIAELNQKDVILNIGKRQGVQKAHRFNVVGTDVVLAVTSVESDRSIAVIESEDAVLTVGQRVEWL
jgi:class 3 adenylate cyclase/CHAT domain-containing protein/cytochrome c-type biogenesis protein CcmH/NrfG